MASEKFEQGLAMRKQVLGDEYVNASLENADAFTMPLQELVTEYCWGTVWQREGLSLKMRSVINLAMITALNRPHELKLHVRGALNNGLSRDEIREVLLQTAVYCGVPAAIDSFRVAKSVFAEEDSKAESSDA
ncbi:MAG: carboxymuconolactone decarboxylase family protein [Marinobacterium sp.]|nr:carboxymuconolactone decarboxylase family protein [Marinobacterium sp.]